jgi:tetratricopeptide (TPR) repeat protein
MSDYSLKQAAEAAGRSKPTVLRAIQSGRLSARRDEAGRWWIERAALFRVFQETIRTGTQTGAISEATAVELLREILDELRQLKAILNEGVPVKVTPTIVPTLTAPSVESDSKTDDIAVVPTVADPEAAELARPAEQRLHGEPPALADNFFDRAGEPEPADLGEAQKASERHGLDIARQLVGRGNAAFAERRYAEAIEHFNQAAAAVPDGHPAHLADCLDWLAQAFYRHGYAHRDNAALNRSIETWRSVLQYHPRGQAPLEWARIQNNLGVAHRTLGERENSAAFLSEAVSAFRAALEERTRDRTPSGWAETLQNLGIALARLGYLQHNTTHLTEATAALRAALGEQPRDRAPLAWAAIQHNLGDALRMLGELSAGTSHFTEAVAYFTQAVTAYQTAMAERTWERAPLEWATTTGNQGVALMFLAERKGDASGARAAVERIEIGLTMMQSHGNTDLAAYYDRQLSSARALLHRLTTR